MSKDSLDTIDAKLSEMLTNSMHIFDISMNCLLGDTNLDTSSDTFLPILFQYINFKFLIVSIICALSLLNIKIKSKFRNNILFTIPLFILSIFIVLSSSVDPFIYFRF